MLKLSQITDLLGAEILTKDLYLDHDVKVIKASDLMSDVLTDCGEGALLITGLTNSQVIRTAEVVDICAIVFVRGKRPAPEIIQLAQEIQMPLLTTKLPMYDTCGILYTKGLIHKQI